MFAASLLSLAVAALSVTALPVPQRNHKTISVRGAPAGWHVDYLENYDVYHDRYVALSCQGRHGDAFFESCCHPLLATETLEGNREAQCNPANLPSASSSAAAPASTSAAPVEEEEEECDAEEETATSSAAPAPVQTTAAEVQAAVAPTTTAPAPAATTTKAAAPATTTKAAAPAVTTKAAAPSGGDEKTGGFATYFYQNGVAGACGVSNPDSLPLVAITAEYYGGDSGRASDNCGRYVNIKNTNNGKTVTAVVADLCPTCVNGNSLDLSVGAFTSIASEADGMVPVTWSWA
jgi:hypothetical protein